MFVQTRSKHFSNGNNGESDFIMSTHSIIRECDSEVELKGSASTSLMKSIIGQSNIVGNQRSPGVLGNSVPNTVSPMAILNALSQPFMPNAGVGLMGSRTDDITDNLDFTQANWDSIIGDLGFGNSNSSSGNSIGVLNNNGNFSLSGGTVTSTSSASSNLWNNMPPQMKSPNSSQQQQQQIMRNMMNMQQQNSGNSNMGTNFPRSNSYDGSCQKSPGFPPSPGIRGTFHVSTSQQNMRGMGGYSGQRSPGSAGMSQNRMSPANVVYPPQRTPPLSGTSLLS